MVRKRVSLETILHYCYMLHFWIMIIGRILKGAVINTLIPSAEVQGGGIKPLVIVTNYCYDERRNVKTIKTLKGFRDFLPAEAAKRKWLRDKLALTCQWWGFSP